jgi:hypothetical protein
LNRKTLLFSNEMSRPTTKNYLDDGLDLSSM